MNVIIIEFLKSLQACEINKGFMTCPENLLCLLI